MLSGRIVLGMALLAACAWAAEEGANDALRQQRKVAQLMQDLGSEDFATRETAERALTDMGPGIHPLVKEKLATEKDTEVKARLTRIEKALALGAETDPEKVAKLAREEALTKRYASAAKYYQRAQELYAKQAVAAKEAAKQKEWTVLAEKNAARQAKAEKFAKEGGEGAGGNRIALGAGTIVVHIEAGGAGKVEKKVIINGQEVEEDGEDW